MMGLTALRESPYMSATVVISIRLGMKIQNSIAD